MHLLPASVYETIGKALEVVRPRCFFILILILTHVKCLQNFESCIKLLERKEADGFSNDDFAICTFIRDECCYGRRLVSGN